MIAVFCGTDLFCQHILRDQTLTATPCADGIHCPPLRHVLPEACHRHDDREHPRVVFFGILADRVGVALEIQFANGNVYQLSVRSHRGGLRSVIACSILLRTWAARPKKSDEGHTFHVSISSRSWSCFRDAIGGSIFMFFLLTAVISWQMCRLFQRGAFLPCISMSISSVLFPC